MLRAGRLQSSIVIDRRTEAQDQDGVTRPDYLPVLSTRAEIITSDARTFLAEAGEITERAIGARIRYRDVIEVGDRVTLDGTHYKVAEIKEVVRRRVLELRCAGKP